MKNKKIFLLIILIFICFISIIGIFLSDNSKSFSYSVGNSSIALMMYDNDINNYIKTSNVPKGNYTLNRGNTKCVAGGKVSNYNAEQGTINYSLLYSDECYIYFDLIGEHAAQKIIGLYNGQGTTVGNGKLYLHDSTLANSAEDNSYRYAGADPDNYACFFGADCTNPDNLYRIIGVFNDEVKLIKYTSIGNMSMMTDYGMADSSIITNYINNEYLTSLGDVASLIDETTWNAGEIYDQELTPAVPDAPAAPDEDIDVAPAPDIEEEITDADNSSEVTNTYEKRTAKEIYDLEQDSLYKGKNKIGLLYISDYGYAAENTYWDHDLYNYSESAGHNWLLDTNNSTWTISTSMMYVDQLIINDKGNLDYNDGSSDLSVRPTFSLNKYAEIISGNGTSSNPYKIKAQDGVYDLSTVAYENTLAIIPKVYNDDIDTIYYYSIDDGKTWVQSQEKKYVFTNLDYAKEYNVKVKTNLSAKELSQKVQTGFSRQSAVSYISSLYKSQGMTTGDGKLYLHNSTLANGANDGSLRYSGINPNNYVCFAGDNCADENNLYRIIGVIDNQVKVIKYKALGESRWSNNKTNDWEGSTLETYLNGEYLTSLGDKAELIADTTWHVGGLSDSDIKVPKTVKNVYDVERADTVTVTKKIGLMYFSDYGFAALQARWPSALYNDTAFSKKEIWILHDSGANNLWAISRSKSDSSYAFKVGVGNWGRYMGFSYPFSPTFNLNSFAYIGAGNGTRENPYIIGK